MKNSPLEQLRANPADPVAPLRRNGELVFEAPWESRAFGIAVALCEAGTYEWEEFRQYLIEEIRRWDREHPDGTAYQYYERWLAALERLLADKGLCQRAQLDDRVIAGED